MAEQLAKGAGNYAEARCILPACGSPLHLTWSGDHPIYLSDTNEVLRDPDRAASVTWQVSCEAGHVVLLPADTGGDYYEFAGHCICNPDYPDAEAEQMCPHNDMNRLRAVVVFKGVPVEGSDNA